MNNFNKVELGFMPTPVHPLTTLSQQLNGPNLFIKRDDHTGLALGGNKTRKLEFILADALAKGADTIITAGAAQSNHCRQTAAACAKLQLECHLMLGGSAPEKAGGNLLLNKLLGSHIHWTGNNRKGEDIEALCQQLKEKGRKPYIVPYGGSNELGAIAFVEAMRELKAQSDINYSHIVFASSSGATHAGMLVGQKLLNLPIEIHGINIDKEAMQGLTLHQYIVNLSNSTAEKIGFDCDIQAGDIILNDNYIGQGYGVVGELEREAIAMLAQTEGILLDPVYTGRAMGGLIDMVRKGIFNKEDNVLFWHTGGAPALFAYSESLSGL